MKKLTNQGKSFVWGAAAIALYAVPLISLAIVKRDKLFMNGETALTFFSIMLIVFFIAFAKKIVKALTKVLTPLGFGSLVVLLVAVGLRSLMDDLYLIALASLLGSVAAWFPYQIAAVYSRNAYDQNGDVIRTAGFSFKIACRKLFQISIIGEEEEENE